MISSVGAGGGKNDVELVKSLVKRYVDNPRCIILLTVVCESECNDVILLNICPDFNFSGS